MTADDAARSASPLPTGSADDLPFDYADAAPATGVGAPRKCRRHEWWMPPVVGPDAHKWDFGANGSVCRRCGVLRDPERARRGRTNRSRGNAIEREVAARLGLQRVGQYGGADDIRGIAFAGQVKSGVAFPERLWRWLKAVPVSADQTAILVVTDAPGAGHRRRALVVLDIDDWQALHGPTEDVA